MKQTITILCVVGVISLAIFLWPVIQVMTGAAQ